MSDRRFDPTPHRRRQARQRGHVARSHDLVSAVLLLAGLGVLAVAGQGLVRFLGGYTASQLGGGAWLSIDAEAVSAHFMTTLGGLARHVLPLFGIVVLGAVAANLAQTGFLFLSERVAPDLSRLDPFRGFARLFSLDNTSRVGFSLAKIVVIGAVAWLDLYAKRDTLLGLGGGTVAQIASFAASVMLWTSLKIGVALLVLALLDYGLQRWKHHRNLKMTPQELREEMRDAEGDPELRARRRRVREQLAFGRLAGAVPRADVVLTGGDGSAVAIRYDAASTAPPTVVAKGIGPLAGRIRQLAARHGVPVIEQGRLAATLHRDVDVGQPIPRAQFGPVARILAQVYQHQGREIPEAA